MDFENVNLFHDIDAVKNIETNNDVSDIFRYNMELDFIEQYQDADGIQHIKTLFNHDDIAEGDLWEVFVPKDGSRLLELLLNYE